MRAVSEAGTAADWARIVYIVDDDGDVRSSIGFMLGTDGTRTQPFAGGEAFLAALAGLEPGCVLLDVRMPDVDGVEVLEEMKRRGIDWPVIVMTGHGEVALAVQTMKLGAIDFLEKPFEEEMLQTCLGRAAHLLQERERDHLRRDEARRRVGSLTERETDVLRGLVAGMPNKAIAAYFGISLRTVEMHRGHMMHRLDVKSLAEALHLAGDAGLAALPPGADAA